MLAISFRRSLSFDTLRLPSGNKTGLHGQCMPGQTNGLFRDLLAHTTNFEDDASRFDDCYPVVDSAFTATHAGLGGFRGDRFVRKDANPYLTTALHKAGERDTGCLDLTRLHPARL